ncbi:heavy-metal-associated domain-containing protein [Sporolactobacillus terrae]|uniref:Heavy metal-binding protein n=1 Tax=Sporolactobacillus terrae TaxID=269673 RepID=A0A5K7X1R3_9BACL|nr:heavy metal-associated domain-containing protein [Sporolactobacillus terrae]BBN99959.1 heavy metal-binding protein [Sporolactobacillus terrae]
MPTVILQLETLTCPSCLQKIESGLARQEGIEKSSVLFNSSKVKAKFDPNKISAEEVAQIVSKLGYEVKSIKVKEI